MSFTFFVGLHAKPWLSCSGMLRYHPHGQRVKLWKGQVGVCICIPQYLSLFLLLPTDWGPQIQCSPDRLSSLYPVLPRYVYKWHDGVQAGRDSDARNGPKVPSPSTRCHRLLPGAASALCLGPFGGPQQDTVFVSAIFHTHSRRLVNKLEPQLVAWDN